MLIMLICIMRNYVESMYCCRIAGGLQPESHVPLHILYMSSLGTILCRAMLQGPYWPESSSYQKKEGCMYNKPIFLLV